MIRKVSRLSGEFLDYPDRVWIVRTFSRLSGQSLDYRDSFLTIRIVSLPTWPKKFLIAKTFQIFAKTFRVAMLPCYHGFSDSDLCVLRKYWTILKSCKNDRIKVDSAKKCDILSRSLEPPFWVVRLFQKRRLYFSKAECWNLCWEILLILRIMLGAVLEDNCVIVGRALHPLFYHSTKLTITKFWSLLVQKLEIKFAFVPG